MNDVQSESDALVFFGATGDLAHEMVFPALQALVKHGRLSVPVIGVAKAGWTLEQLKARARDSLQVHGGGVDSAAFDKLSSLLRYVDGVGTRRHLVQGVWVHRRRRRRQGARARWPNARKRTPMTTEEFTGYESARRPAWT